MPVPPLALRAARERLGASGRFEQQVQAVFVDHPLDRLDPLVPAPDVGLPLDDCARIDALVDQVERASNGGRLPVGERPERRIEPPVVGEPARVCVHGLPHGRQNIPGHDAGSRARHVRQVATVRRVRDVVPWTAQPDQRSLEEPPDLGAVEPGEVLIDVDADPVHWAATRQRRRRAARAR